MNVKTIFWNPLNVNVCFRKSCGFSSNCRGQALVEFTLVFLLLLVISWIPAEFGLAFYSGQLAQNAAREGARIAAADPTLISGTNGLNCFIPTCYSRTDVLRDVAVRVPMAFMSNVNVQLDVDASTPGNCNEMVTMTVSGTYHFFFYELLKLMGGPASTSAPITRKTSMRWEYQPGCSLT